MTQPEEQSQQESAEQTDTQPEQTQDSGETQENEQQTAPQAQTQTDIPKASPQVNEVNGVVQNTGGQTAGTQSSAAQPYNSAARRSRQGMDRLGIRRSPKINRAARKPAETYSTRQAVLRL